MILALPPFFVHKQKGVLFHDCASIDGLLKVVRKMHDASLGMQNSDQLKHGPVLVWYIQIDANWCSAKGDSSGTSLTLYFHGS